MGNRLFVGNLPFEATEDQIRGLVGADGRVVKSVKMITDKETGRPRGFAFVDMENDQQAKDAIAALDGQDFGGRNLKVNEAQDKPGFGPRGGGGGGGGFGGGGGGRDRFGGGGGGGGFGARGQDFKRGSQRGGGRGGSRGS